MKRSPEVNPLRELEGQDLFIGGKGGRAGIGLATLFASVSHLPDKMTGYSDRQIPTGLATRGLDIGSLTGLVSQVLDVNPASLSTADLTGFPTSIARQSMTRSLGESEVRQTTSSSLADIVAGGIKARLALVGTFGKVERRLAKTPVDFNNASKSMTKKWQKAMKKQAKAFTQ